MDTNMIYSQGALEYHLKVIATPYDGSNANYHSKVEAMKYVYGWIEKLEQFASESDTQVSVICSTEAKILERIIVASKNTDGINFYEPKNRLNMNMRGA